MTYKMMSILLMLLPACCIYAVSPVEQPLKFEEYTVFDGNKGWECDGVTYKLACAALIVECSNGDLLCGWLSGSGTEPATDNCFLISRSADGGRRWSQPKILIAAGDMAGIVTNFHITRSGQLVALGAKWPSDKEYTEWHYFKITSDDNGARWSQPENFVLHGNHGYIGSGPMYLNNGKCLYVGGFFEKRKVPLTADVRDLAAAVDEKQALAINSSQVVSPQQMSGKFGTHLHGCCAYIADDDASVDFRAFGHIANRPLGLLEPTAVQLDDGRIVMLMRAEWGGFLWRSESRDNGTTWSPAEVTDIPNPSCLPYLIKTTDGRIALIHNPSGGIVGKRGPRSPMSVWISSDNMKTWEIKQDIAAGGKLAYPNAILYKNRLVFVYDKNRREVKYIKLELPQIQKITNAK